MRNKSFIVVAMVLALMFVPLVHHVEASHDSPGQAFAKNVPDTLTFLLKRVLYYTVAFNYASRGLDVLSSSLEEFILMNPSPQHPVVLDIIRFFVSLLQPFYVLAISITGFYLIFVSSSPAGRNKAKSTLIKLVFSLVIISLTPQVMTIALYTTENITSSILGQADISYYTYALNEAMNTLQWIHLWASLINIEMGYYSFLPPFFIVWGTYVMLTLRFIAVLLWIVMFPLAVFLYSFTFTKNIGRNMLEQTILWSSMQIFNALLVAVAAIGMISKEPGFMHIQALISGIDIILIAGVFSLVVAPALMLIWFRNFLP
ncbi:MAG: hypothetical protein B6U97_00805 [Candidatus Altiarchaeales archaeon ex4484_96]|nr:MAG: hypothetical protein B6U97_00805 [Candidatus Altiarchaeales archaeon ex4484_96]